MAMLKYGHAVVATPVVDPGKWLDKVTPAGRVKVAKNVIATYDPSKWLLSHMTIVASVDVDFADPSDKNSNYLIKPEYSIFVNNNGDSWERGLLRQCAKTFLGVNNYCFPTGTRVLMSDGTYKPIEQIKEGDFVINRLGKAAKVTHTFVRQTDNLVELRSKGIMSRSLFVTDNHPFWVYSARNNCPKTGRPNGFDRDKEFWHLDSWRGFSVGVHQAAEENYPCGVTPFWKDAGNLDINRDFLTHPISDVEVPNDEVNENRAILIGWFLAQGFYMQTNGSSDDENGVTFALGNEEYDVACMISEKLTEEFGDEFRTDAKVHIRETESGSYNVWVSNKAVVKFFKKWCGKYAWAKKLDEAAMWLPKNLQAKILKACIDGDGCGTSASRGYRLEMKSRALIQQFQWIAWRLGIKPVYKETGVLPRYSSCELIDGYEVFSDPSTGKRSRPGYMLRFCCRDSKALDQLAGVVSSPMYDKGDKKRTLIFKNEEGSWAISKINEINPVDGTFEVHNIEVEGDNSYVVEGVVVHNCEHVQIPELAKGKVIDVALREVPFMKGPDGKDLTTLYVDILVATNRKHTDLIEKITSGEYNACSMGCFLEGTEITMADGTKRRIEDVRPGDIVITHTGAKHTVNNLQIRYKTKETILKISFEGDYKDIYVTKEHPFWAFSREQTCACGCGTPIKAIVRGGDKNFMHSRFARGHYARVANPNDKVLSFHAKDEIPTQESLKLSWIEAGKLSVGDFLSYPISSVTEQDTNATVDKARLLGYFVAKGSYVKEVSVEGKKENEYAVRCKICGRLYNRLDTHVRAHGVTAKEYLSTYPGSVLKAAKNKSLIRGASRLEKLDGVGLKKTRRDIGIEFSLGSKEYDTLNKEIAEIAKRVFPTATILRYEKSVKVISDEACAFMREYCGEYSDRKKLLEKVLYWPVEIQKHLVATWFIGDYACTVSKDLFDQFRFIMARCGIRYNSYMENAEEYECQNVQTVNGATVSVKTFSGIRKASFSHQINSLGLRQIQAELNYAFPFHHKKLEGDPYRTINSYASYKNGYFLRKIKAIEEIVHTGPVYNLEVEGDNSYIANDVAVHNCLILFSICSQCGNIAEDESKACKHVRFFKKNFFYDKNGVRRIVAELCGRADKPESCRFIDASWVRKPAFEGAVLRNIIEPNNIDLSDKFQKAFAVPGFVKMDGMYLKAAAAKAAEDIVNEIEAQDEKPAPKNKDKDPAPKDPPPEAPATEAPPSMPADDSRFPEAPPETDAPLTKDEPPSAEVPSEGGAGGLLGLGGGGGEAPAGTPEGAPDQAPQVQIEEPVQDATVKEVKDMLKKLVLNDIRRELLKGGTGMATQPDQRPTEAENASQTSLVKDASIGRIVKKASKEVGDRLANGLLIMSNLNDWGRMRRYGYSRDDVLGILWYLDRSVSRQPVAADAVKALSRVRLASDGDAKRFFTEMIVEMGRKPSVSESRRLLKWAGILKRIEE